MKYTEQWHSSHPEHELKLVYSENLYKCDGCKELGLGPTYRCDTCDFDLHEDCMFPTSSTSHAFYRECTFYFFDHSPGENVRYCDACGRDIQGFVYHCETCDRDLHPCCRNLPCMIQGEEMKLELYEKVSSECCKCGRKELWKGVTGWSYMSKCRKYHIHVSCVRELLVENWKKNYLVEKNSRALVDRESNLQLSCQVNSNKSGGKIRKYWRIAKLVIQVIISTILGDPTAWISGLIVALAV